MGKKFHKSLILMAVVTMFTMLSFAVSAGENAKELDVLFVHDTHSHLSEFVTIENGESQIMGGFAKIKTLINEKRAEN